MRGSKTVSQGALFVRHFPHRIPVAEIFLASKQQGAESQVCASSLDSRSQGVDGGGWNGLEEEKQEQVALSPHKAGQTPPGQLGTQPPAGSPDSKAQRPASGLMLETGAGAGAARTQVQSHRVPLQATPQGPGNLKAGPWGLDPGMLEPAGSHCSASGWLRAGWAHAPRCRCAVEQDHRYMHASSRDTCDQDETRPKPEC